MDKEFITNLFGPRFPEKINLLAVSKGHNETLIRSLADLGQIDFGESRLQEALLKMENLRDLTKIRWHFVGKLQKNKVRGVVRAFDVIHSVDSLDLAERISRIAREEDKEMKIFLQVKLRKDDSKGGFETVELFNAIKIINTLPSLDLAGLMTITPFSLVSEERKELFVECRELANKLGLEDCSMGMSSDWQEAVDAGATWIRIGSLLFGERSN